MKFQRRGVYTSCDGRDAQFVPDGDRGRFRFHAEQAPINDVQRDLDVVVLAVRTRRPQTSLFMMETASVRVHAARRAVFACEKYLLGRGATNATSINAGGF